MLTSGQSAFVAAMMKCGGNVAHAAAAIQISQRTAWRWMGLPAVKSELAGVAGDLLNRLSDDLSGHVHDAVEVLSSIMLNEAVSVAVRVSAAATILQTSARVAAVYGAPQEGGGQNAELEMIWERLRVRASAMP